MFCMRTKGFVRIQRGFICVQHVLYAYQKFARVQNSLYAYKMFIQVQNIMYSFRLRAGGGGGWYLASYCINTIFEISARIIPEPGTMSYS